MPLSIANDGNEAILPSVERAKLACGFYEFLGDQFKGSFFSAHRGGRGLRRIAVLCAWGRRFS